MSSQYTVRPSNSERAPFRINFTAASLLSLKLRSGDLCNLSFAGDVTSDRIAIAWENSSSGMKDGVVQTSKFLQELYGIKLGDRVTIQRSPERLTNASHVILRSEKLLSDQEKTSWSFIAAATIRHKYDVLAPSQNIVVEAGPLKEEFEVKDIGSPLGRITTETLFSFEDNASQTAQTLSLKFPTVGGLPAQTQHIRNFVNACFSTELSQRYPGYRQKQGLLLYGAKGTGKSLMLSALRASGWSSIVGWTPGVKVGPSRGLQLVTMELDSIGISDKIVAEIEFLFESIQSTATIVVACTRHPNNVPERLRKTELFSTELEFPIPDATQRLDILKVCRGPTSEPNDADLSVLAQRTHGFVGADLRDLVYKIWETAFERHENQAHQDTTNPYTNATDVEDALCQIRPSALQEIFLEKPNVHWSDIGGQHEIKEQLQDAIEFPLKHPERMKKLGLVPAKGVLLYGPPGCSKTLMVKALATEADYNFLAVKGAELISMYVGESEKATREVFRKARQASPSIIFFDEIDAIASRGRSGSDLNVLTTLLNEMDGFEELKNVMVIAATNKPESIDPALMRPGRFDSVVYVGPPDLNTRKDIFDKRFAGISVTERVRMQTADFAQSTAGSSGAEIVAICQKAGWLALKSNEDSIAVEHVEQAISQTPKGITADMLQSYEEWNASRTR